MPTKGLYFKCLSVVPGVAVLAVCSVIFSSLTVCSGLTLDKYASHLEAQHSVIGLDTYPKSIPSAAFADTEDASLEPLRELPVQKSTLSPNNATDKENTMPVKVHSTEFLNAHQTLSESLPTSSAWITENVNDALPTEVELGQPLQMSKIGISSLDDLRQTEVMWLINTLCAEYDFIECERQSSGEHPIVAGANGGGVKALLKNDNPDLRLYRNCGFASNMTEPMCSPECYVDPKKVSQIEVFLKVVKTTAEQRNSAFSTNKSLSALQKEIRRTRAGHIEINGVSLGPSTYEVTTAKDGKWHVLHNDAILQEWVNGKTSYQLFCFLLVTSSRSLLFDLSKLVEKYRDYLDLQLTLPDDTEIHENAWRVVRAMVDRAAIEIQLRYRLILSLSASIFRRAIQIWNNRIFHCDLHSNNMMHLWSYETNPAEVLRILNSGEGFIPSFEHGVYYSAQTLQSSVQSKLTEVHSNGKVGVPMVKFHAEYMRFIDLAMLLKVPPENSRKVNTPCRTLRPKAHEDLNELMRTMVDTILDKNFYLPPDPSDVAPEFADQGVGQKLFEQVIHSYNEVNDSRSEMVQQITALPQVQSCRDSYTDKSKVCTVGDMQDAGEAIMSIIKRSANKLRVPVFFEG